MDNIVDNYKVYGGKPVVNIPAALKTKADAKKYADSAVAQLCQQVGIVVSSDDFYEGFHAARKELRQKLLKAINQGKKQSKRDEEPERIEYLNFLRARVKLIAV